MKTTIDIPKELIQTAKIHAVRNGTSLKEMVIRGLKQQVKVRSAPRAKVTVREAKMTPEEFTRRMEALSEKISATSITDKSLVEIIKEGRD